MYDLPYRVKIKNNQFFSLSEEEQYIVLTRDYNGFIRQEAVNKLISMTNSIYNIVPFIIRIACEYVDEISLDIYQNREILRKDDFREFYNENKLFIQRQQMRAISYWNEYYRFKYNSYQTSPAVLFLEWIKLL